MNSLASAHWWTPCVILSSFVIGVVFTIGHHIFYQSLAGKPTATSNYAILGTELSPQSINLAVGNTFAFLVKSAYVLSISAVYYQLFWDRFKRDSANGNPPPLTRLDDTFAALDNVIPLVKILLWIRYPLLCYIATTAWLLPIVSIITPTTLSVELHQDIPTPNLQHVPQTDFASLNFVANMPYQEVEPQDGQKIPTSFYMYDGPSEIVSEMAMAVAAGGDILPVVAPSLNSSYTLTFAAPSLKCGVVSQSQRWSFANNIEAYYLQQLQNCDFLSPPTYLAWFAQPESNITVPYSPNQFNSTLSSLNPTEIWDFNSNQKISTGNLEGLGQLRRWEADAVFYVAVMPNVVNYGYAYYQCLEGRTKAKTGAQQMFAFNGTDTTMLRCQMYNSTYETEFEFQNGGQNVTTTLINEEDDQAMSVTNVLMYSSMNAIQPVNPADVTTAALQAARVELSQMAYQGILEAFTSLITGNITYGAHFGELASSTNVRSTGLLNTKDLIYLTKQTGDASNPTLQSDLRAVGNENVTGLSGLSSSSSTTPNRSLSSALEELFKNLTISFISSPALRANFSLFDAPPMVQVTELRTQNVYVYSALRLWIAYGLATIFTLLSALLGMSVILRSGVSYSDNFSTILRTALAADISVQVSESDMDGKDPLPKYLAEATISIGHNEKQP